MDKIKKLFGISPKGKQQEVDLNEERFSSWRAFKSIARVFTGQWRPVAGPDMPKYQPCPECHRGCKRDRKTVAGAVYKCRRCDGFEFMVVNKAAASALTIPERIKAGAV